MTPQEMLAKLMHHEVLDDEAKEALNQWKSIALTTSHGSASSHCNKGCCEHKHKDDDDLDEEQAMLVGKYKNYLRMNKDKDKMRRYGGNKSCRKRFCYECGDTDHIAFDCPNKGKKSRYNKQGDKKYKYKKRGEAHLGQEWQLDIDSDDDDNNEKKSTTAVAIQERSSPTKIFTDDTSSTSLCSGTSSSPRLFVNLSNNDHDSPTCLVARGDMVQIDSSTYTTNECDSEDENDESYTTNLIKKYSKPAATKILKLIYAKDKLESCTESQGELLLEEREKNQGLEACLSKEKERVEKLSVELSLIKDANERLAKEHSLLNKSLASLKNDHSLA